MVIFHSYVSLPEGISSLSLFCWGTFNDHLWDSKQTSPWCPCLLFIPTPDDTQWLDVPSGNDKIAENGPVEIVDLSSYKMIIFHSYVNVYQRVGDNLNISEQFIENCSYHDIFFARHGVQRSTLWSQIYIYIWSGNSVRFFDQYLGHDGTCMFILYYMT